MAPLPTDLTAELIAATPVAVPPLACAALPLPLSLSSVKFQFTQGCGRPVHCWRAAG